MRICDTITQILAMQPCSFRRADKVILNAELYSIIDMSRNFDFIFVQRTTISPKNASNML